MVAVVDAGTLQQMHVGHPVHHHAGVAPGGVIMVAGLHRCVVALVVIAERQVGGVVAPGVVWIFLAGVGAGVAQLFQLEECGGVLGRIGEGVWDSLHVVVVVVVVVVV